MKFKIKALKCSASKIFERAFKGLLVLLMIVYCISLLIPIIWMLYTSFKSYQDYYASTYALPQKWIFDNYPSMISKLKITVTTSDGRVTYGIFSMLGFSFTWAFGVSALGVFVTTLVAYVISRYEFFGKKFLYALGIIVMITPVIGNLASAMVVRKTLGVYNNIFLMIITSPSTAFSGLYFLLMYAAFKRLSWSYAEAVFMDGGGHYTALFRVMLPMMLPTCVAIFVLNFLAGWNDYQTFLVWLPDFPNLAYGMYRIQFATGGGGSVPTMPEVLAGFTVVMIPTSIVYLSLQNIILSKFTVGGLKG